MRGSFCPAFFFAICRKTLSPRLPPPEPISHFKRADREAPGFLPMERNFASPQYGKQQKKKEKVPLAQLVKAL